LLQEFELSCREANFPHGVQDSHCRTRRVQRSRDRAPADRYRRIRPQRQSAPGRTARTAATAIPRSACTIAGARRQATGRARPRGCISRALHGEIKLPGRANLFYEQAIAAHLPIGISACERLRAEGLRLHSRKLRAFDEPPFR
jgi:hypothetical protein